MMFLNSKKSFERMGSELTMTLDLEISYYTDLRQTRGDKTILKTVLNTRLKNKETTYTLVLGNTLLSLSEATQ
jgi:hypothetical protein